MTATPAQIAVAMSGILDRAYAGRPCTRVDQEFPPHWPHKGPAVVLPQCSRHGGEWDTENDRCPHAVMVANAIASA